MTNMTPLGEGLTVVKVTETESGMAAAQGWGRGGWEIVLHGYGVSAWEDEESSGHRW